MFRKKMKSPQAKYVGPRQAAMRADALREG